MPISSEGSANANARNIAHHYLLYIIRVLCASVAHRYTACGTGATGMEANVMRQKSDPAQSPSSSASRVIGKSTPHASRFNEAKPREASKPETDTHILKVPQGTPVNVTVGDRSAIPGGWHSGFNRVYEWGYFAHLSPAAKAVYKILEWRADYSNGFMINAGPDGRGVGYTGTYTGLGYTGIARYAGVSVESVKRAMAEMSALDLVRTIRRQRYFKGGEAPNAPKQYQLTVPAIPAADHIADLDPARRKLLYRNGDPIHTETETTINHREGSPTTPPYGRPQPIRKVSHDPTPSSRPAIPSARRSPGNVVADDTINKKIRTSKNSNRVAADDLVDQLELELTRRGVGSPLLETILTSADPELIRSRLLDFDVRNKLPGQPRKTAGWLVKAILVPYSIHEATAKQLENQTQSLAAVEHKRALAEKHDAEANRQAELDAWVEDQFASSDDEELESLRERVITEYGSVARGLDKADPRTHPRLSRLIKGVLSQLFRPGT